jgi:hypothetical protein
MARGVIEIYAQIAVRMADDPKVRALARFGIRARLARDLYVQMILYCKDTMSDGFVPDEQIGVLCYPDPPGHGTRDAQNLERVGLVQRRTDGWYVMAFLKRNPSRATIEADSEARYEEAQRLNHERWHVNRGKRKPDCPFCITKRSGSRSPPDPIRDPIRDPNTDPVRESTETETETETYDRTSSTSVDARALRTRTTKGSRLADDFEPTPEMVDWAREKAPTAKRADHEAFCDYWRAQPGQRGVKLDWPATWRNWMRREQERRSNGRGAGAGSRVSTTDQRVAAGLALAAELEAQNRAQTDPRELTA